MQQLFTVLILGAGLALGTQAFAGDHLASASGALGHNPVGAENPSGVSGPASDPGSVPGQGDPNAGNDTGTPSVEEDGGQTRAAARSNN